MNTETEIAALEERLRLAELGPDSQVFEELLDDNLVIVDEEGKPSQAKPKIVKAHQAPREHQFTKVTISNMHIITHGGTAAVVTCRGSYESPAGEKNLKFMRVWLRKDNSWRVVAGSITKDE